MQKFDERGRLDPRGILMQKLEGERFSEGLERGSDDVGQAAVSFAQGFSSGAPLQKDSSLHQNWGLRSRGRGSRKKNKAGDQQARKRGTAARTGGGGPTTGETAGAAVF